MELAKVFNFSDKIPGFSETGIGICVISLELSIMK